MSLTVSAPEGGSRWPLLEAGTYPAVCFGLVDIGAQENKMYNNVSRKVVIMWEIPSETMAIDGKTETRVISETYTSSLGDKANLRKMLEGWRGRPFTEQELMGFDLHNILGMSCLLGTIVKDKNGGGQFAKIGTVSKLPKGFPPVAGRKDKIVFDLDEPGALDAMANLPEWLQTRIKESTTYKRLTGGFEDIEDENNPFSDIQEDDLPFEL